MTNFLDNVNLLGQLLNDGKVILCPTDTIWGLSCDAFHKEAVDRIFEIKKRDKSKTMILLVDSIDRLKELVIDLHPRIETLLAFYTSPLTIIHKAANHVPEYLIGPDSTVAIRITTNELLTELIGFCGNPLVSSSANVQGSPSPENFDMISLEIKEQVDYVCFSGRASKTERSESTIIKYNQEGELFFLR